MTLANSRAVVIGIERYYTTESGYDDVSGPAYDAAQFARYLQDQGMPRDSITLLVTALSENAAYVDNCFPVHGSAIESAVKDALTAGLRNVTGDKLIVFFAGHAYQARLKGQQLYVPTSNDPDRPGTVVCVDLNELTSWLESERVAFPDQLVIVDACRWRDDHLGVPNETMSFPRAPVVLDRRQQVIHAAPSGRDAGLSDAENTSLFCKALRPRLAGDPWGKLDRLPDVEELANRLGADNAWSTPMVFGRRDNSGINDEFTVGRPPRDAILDAECDQVVHLLSRVPKFDAEKRQQLIDALKTELVGYSAESDSFEDIVDELADYDRRWVVLRNVIDAKKDSLFPPGKEAVIELRERVVDLCNDESTKEQALTEFEAFWRKNPPYPTDWHDAYYRTVHGLHDLAPPTSVVGSSLKQILNATAGGAKTGCEFIERLAQLLPADRAAGLRAVNRAVAAKLGVLPEDVDRIEQTLAMEPPRMRMHLSVRIDRTADHDPVSAWTSYRPRVPGSVPIADTKGVPVMVDKDLDSTTGGVPAVLSGILSRKHAWFVPELPADRRPVIELIVDWAEFGTCFDEMMVNLPEGRTRLGRLGPVVLRPLEWSTSTDLPERRRRWVDMTSPDAGVERMWQVYDLDGDPAKQAAGCVGVAVCLQSADPRDLVRRAHAAGLHVAVWSSAASDVITLMNGRPISELIDQVYVLRENEECRLVLMWDDPHWVPRGQVLEWIAS